MRFRFCGDLDAPDWLLAEIATLSKVLTTTKIYFGISHLITDIFINIQKTTLLPYLFFIFKIPAQKMKVLLREVVKYMLTDEIDYTELSKVIYDNNIQKRIYFKSIYLSCSELVIYIIQYMSSSQHA
jgi:hypothetical protein